MRAGQGWGGNSPFRAPSPPGASLPLTGRRLRTGTRRGRSSLRASANWFPDRVVQV